MNYNSGAITNYFLYTLEKLDLYKDKVYYDVSQQEYAASMRGDF